MAIKVGVLGAAGKMGRTVCDAVEADPDLALVARVDPFGGEGFAPSRDAVVDAGAEVVIDFTRPDAVFENVCFCLEKGIHCVVGTTGMSDAELDKIAELASAGEANAFVAPNFSIGAVLMMHLSTLAARHMGSCEIVEMHHNQKLDAPSGTAQERMARVLADPTLRRAPKGDGHHVLVMPGLGGSDLSTRVMRAFLRRLGYYVHAWRLGRNLGPTDHIIDGLAERFGALTTERPITLIG